MQWQYCILLVVLWSVVLHDICIVQIDMRPWQHLKWFIYNFCMCVCMLTSLLACWCSFHVVFIHIERVQFFMIRFARSIHMGLPQISQYFQIIFVYYCAWFVLPLFISRETVKVNSLNQFSCLAITIEKMLKDAEWESPIIR